MRQGYVSCGSCESVTPPASSAGKSARAGLACGKLRRRVSMARLREAPAPGEHGEVESRLIELASPRYGHFDLGTGYHGDVWLELDRLFLPPALLRPQVRVLADRLREHRVDAVCGPMDGGVFLAYALAELLGVAFLPAYRAPASAARSGAGCRCGPAGGWAGQSDHGGGAVGAVLLGRRGAEPGVAARRLPTVRRRRAADGFLCTRLSVRPADWAAETAL